MTFTEIKQHVRVNLEDQGVVGYSTTAMSESIQDAYDDITSRSRCIVKKTTVNFIANLTYYDFRSLVSDFMCVTAIFNNNTNLWLKDNLTLRDFRRCRRDWEIAEGAPEYWAPNGVQYTALFPRYATATGNMDLYYAASAPTVVDGDTPLIVTDKQRLIELYSTADLIEVWGEVSKAQSYWDEYEAALEEYTDRVQNLAKSDLLRLA